MRKLFLVLPFLVASNSALAELPTVGGIKLGAELGKDIPFCNLKATTGTGASRAPEEVGLCVTKLPEYSLQSGRDRYKVHNSKATVFGKIKVVDTYNNRIWKVALDLNNKYDSIIKNAEDYVSAISDIVDRKAHAQSEGYLNTYACGTRSRPKTCWSGVRKYWFSEDVTYTLEFSNPEAIGSFTAEARFGAPKEKVSTFEPLIK